MAAIQNARDVLLQAAAVRVVPVSIQIENVVGLGDALKSLEITASAASFIGAVGTPTPATITLTAHFKNGLTGTVTWSVVTGTATLTPSGMTCSVLGSSVTGDSVTIRASVNDGGTVHKSQYVLLRQGALSAVDKVNLINQVTGKLASGNVTGLGALALLNKIDLNTQTVGALNGATQVNNLGTLAYANAIAADQIGAGTLAAGVIYAGTINANKVNAGSFAGKEFTGGTFTGTWFRTAATGRRVEMISNGPNAHEIRLTDSNNSTTSILSANPAVGHELKANGVSPALSLLQYGFDGYSLSVAGNGFGAYITTPKLGLSIEMQATQPHAYFKPLSSLPAVPSAGHMLMHTTHGLCISNGTAWRKVATEAV